MWSSSLQAGGVEPRVLTAEAQSLLLSVGAPGGPCQVALRRCAWDDRTFKPPRCRERTQNLQELLRLGCEIRRRVRGGGNEADGI